MKNLHDIKFVFIHPKLELNKEGVKSHYSFMTQKWFQFFLNFAVDFTQFISLLTHHEKEDKLDLCENVFISGERRYLLFRQFTILSFYF